MAEQPQNGTHFRTLDKRTHSGVSPTVLVIGTNDSSILSKRSAERLGYFTRPQFLKHFINKPQRRTSLINIGYTIRTLAIDLIIKRFLENQPPPSKPVVIVNLGCGYDPGFFKLAGHLSDRFTHYIDVDYPELIAKKFQLIAQSEELKTILPSFTSSNVGHSVPLPNSNASYTLLGCDLCDSQQFIQNIMGLIDGKNDAHILFISEVSTVYMPINKSDELIQNLSLSFPNAIWSCLEQVLSPTPTAFSDTMLKHFQKLRTPIRGTLAYPTLSDQLKRLASCWNKIEMSTMHDIWKAFDQHPATRAEKEKLLRLEEFDEWEELDLFLSHYVVAIAYSKPGLWETPPLAINMSLPPLQDRSQDLSRLLSSHPPAKPGLPWNYAAVDSPIHRRGHTSTALPNGQLLIFGGFGLPNSIKVPGQNQKALLTHSRLSHPIILDVSRDPSIQTVQLPIDPSTPSARLHHSSSLFVQDDQTSCVFLFGGRSSPRVPLADAYIFHCTKHAWTAVSPSGAEHSWPSPRFRHSALSVRIKHSTYVLIHGGIGLEGVILDDAWLFDPNQSCWIRLIGMDKLIGPRHSHQMYYDSRAGELYFFGGITTVCDQEGTSRIGNNVKLALAFGKDLGLEIRSDWPELVDLKLNGALVQRYSHQIAVWDEQHNTLIMSGGISENGVITTEHQYVLLNMKSRECHLLQLPRQKAQTMIGHQISVINLPQKGDSCRSALKAALVIGGGATCFSFGSSFDTLAEILSDSDLSLAERTDSSEKNENGFNLNACATLDHSSEDTWDQVEEVPRIGKLTSQSWMDAISASKPVVFNTRGEIGECIELWTPEYLKTKCGEKKCSVHLSHPQASTTLKWHDKNFKYETMSFHELIDRTTGAQPCPLEKRDQVVYLRSLSHSPKQASNFHTDFPEISNDFKIPQPVNDYITPRDAFFSSVLRISGADMGLWAHYDTYDNILVQVQGEKKVRLWHPREIVNLYIDGSSSHIPSLDSPDLERFPLYRKSHPVVCILKTLAPSISVNTFFRTERLEPFYEPGKKDVWGNLDLAPYHHLHHRLFSQLSSIPPHPPPDQHAPLPSLQATGFNHLPLQQRQFYLKKIAIDLIRYADQLTDSS
ncbi:hypothetical protein PCASD_05323 [Puccinia coronata f. sp. avenae]|uniref:tRNA wybutosine-synthesizing protein 4 n=1 Tax=Puccinia coronata f. sp. avenae TaxID=200324 RepID=A0A2N5UND8_9BASI|nr:hypothetical protein PCASD_05323 [Puccinia coronata f. sp. avenae]